MRKFEIIARLVSHSKRMGLSLTYDTVIFKLCTKTLKTEHGFMFSYLNLIRPKKKKTETKMVDSLIFKHENLMKFDEFTTVSG